MEVKCVGQSWESLGLQHLSEEATCLEPTLWMRSDYVLILVMPLASVTLGKS